ASDHDLAPVAEARWEHCVEFFDLDGSKRVRGIQVSSYVLDSDKDARRFQTILPEVIGVMVDAYGNRVLPPREIVRRLYSGGHVVVVATDADSGRLVGASYIRGDGKRGATAVLRRYQGCGIAGVLVTTSLSYFKHQFTEVREENARMIR